MKRPYGHNGNPETSPNKPQVLSEFRFYKESGITLIKTKITKLMTWPYEEIKRFLADIISAE